MRGPGNILITLVASAALSWHARPVAANTQFESGQLCTPSQNGDSQVTFDNRGIHSGYFDIVWCPIATFDTAYRTVITIWANLYNDATGSSFLCGAKYLTTNLTLYSSAEVQQSYSAGAFAQLYLADHPFGTASLPPAFSLAMYCHIEAVGNSFVLGVSATSI